MTDNTNNILSLDSAGAMDFFMKSNQYHSFELPEYFVFDTLLQHVRATVADKPYDDCLSGTTVAEELTDVNFDILLNKDGRYAVRPLMLANPFLYYFLVRELCSEAAWPTVKALFEKFRVPGITSCALPVIPYQKKKKHSTSQPSSSTGGKLWSSAAWSCRWNTATCLLPTSPTATAPSTRKPSTGLSSSTDEP